MRRVSNDSTPSNPSSWGNETQHLPRILKRGTPLASFFMQRGERMKKLILFALLLCSIATTVGCHASGGVDKHGADVDVHTK